VIVTGTIKIDSAIVSVTWAGSKRTRSERRIEVTRTENVIVVIALEIALKTEKSKKRSISMINLVSERVTVIDQWINSERLIIKNVNDKWL
jgi:hypothetical protein